MFNNAIQTVTSTATVMIGTAFLALSAAAIASPAHANTPANFVKAVETSIDQTLDLPADAYGRKGVVTVAVTVAANGSVSDVSVAKSSGIRTFDLEAVRAAKRVAYPATGQVRTLALVLGFGKNATAHEAVEGKRIVDAMLTDSRRLLATDTKAQPIG
jgi:TonB family protein